MIITNQKTFTWSSFRLANAKVHVWHASLEQPTEVVHKLRSGLAKDELERAEAFQMQEHRHAYVVSQGILRNLLYHYTGIKPERIQFKYTLSGKPVLDNGETDSNICFNLSQAGLLVIYAFSWGRQVGIDVKCIRHPHEMDQIARQNFSANEYRRFQRLDEEIRLRAFYNCWIRKEAFIKARGDGLPLSLQNFEVSFEPGFQAELLSVWGSRDQASLWSMHDMKTWDGYAAALVVEGHDYAMSHRQWAYSRFLEEAGKAKE